MVDSGMHNTNQNLSIYLVDDDCQVRLSFTQMLELDGYSVTAFESAEALLSAQIVRFDANIIVISDIKMPHLSGLGLLDEIMLIDAEIPVVLITGHADINMAIDGMQRGAYNFIEKPVKPNRILSVIKKASRQRELYLENKQLKKQLNDQDTKQNNLIGTHDKTQLLKQQINNLASANVDVLINGETGAGKEVVAQLLHQQSSRANHPFVALNCGAIPTDLIESELFGHEQGAFTNANKKRIGKIEYANHGTLFLDEIESMPSDVQVKLLRVLQERSIQRLGSNESISLDFNVIAASKVNLHDACEKGEFRPDLLYRLDVATINIPPLRERGDDAILLFHYFAELAAKKYQRDFAPSHPMLQQKLLNYEWPGNVRECQNLAEKWILGVQDKRLQNEHCFSNEQQTSLEEKMNCFERELIKKALNDNKWKIAQTADSLNIPRKKLYLRMQKHGIKEHGS